MGKKEWVNKAGEAPWLGAQLVGWSFVSCTRRLGVRFLVGHIGEATDQWMVLSLSLSPYPSSSSLSKINKHSFGWALTKEQRPVRSWGVWSCSNSGGEPGSRRGERPSARHSEWASTSDLLWSNCPYIVFTRKCFFFQSEWKSDRWRENGCRGKPYERLMERKWVQGVVWSGG